MVETGLVMQLIVILKLLKIHILTISLLLPVVCLIDIMQYKWLVQFPAACSHMSGYALNHMEMCLFLLQAHEMVLLETWIYYPSHWWSIFLFLSKSNIWYGWKKFSELTILLTGFKSQEHFTSSNQIAAIIQTETSVSTKAASTTGWGHCE